MMRIISGEDEEDDVSTSERRNELRKENSEAGPEGRSPDVSELQGIPKAGFKVFPDRKMRG
jgi:hypothetical protein